MTSMETEQVFIRDKKGVVYGPIPVLVDDPQFWVIIDKETDSIPFFRGDTLVRNIDTKKIEERYIVAVSIVASIGIEILAPKTVIKPDINAPYIKYPDTPIGVPKQYIELRPGSIIIGGRESGFYDNYGVILEAHNIGGDREKFEDWAYYVLAKSYGEYITTWILLDKVGFAVSPPTSITNFKLKPNDTVDELLLSGEQELFEYLFKYPNKISNLTPKQFEELIIAIYKNLGFSTEPVGAWNQPDGGVDIVAVSKTIAGTEFRIAIQCKTSKNKISAKPIRELAGVLEFFKAHQGIIATTSRFTSSAINETEGHLWKISLQDRDDFQKKIYSILMPEIKKMLERSH